MTIFSWLIPDDSVAARIDWSHGSARLRDVSMALNRTTGAYHMEWAKLRALAPAIAAIADHYVQNTDSNTAKILELLSEQYMGTSWSYDTRQPIAESALQALEDIAANYRKTPKPDSNFLLNTKQCTGLIAFLHYAKILASDYPSTEDPEMKLFQDLAKHVESPRVWWRPRIVVPLVAALAVVAFSMNRCSSVDTPSAEIKTQTQMYHSGR